MFGAFEQTSTILHLNPNDPANKARNRSCSFSRAENSRTGQNSLQLSSSTAAHALSKTRHRFVVTKYLLKAKKQIAKAH